MVLDCSGSFRSILVNILKWWVFWTIGSNDKCRAHNMICDESYGEYSWIFCIALWWRFWSDEYSGGLVRLMQGLHGEWLPCPTSPTVTHTKTPRRGQHIQKNTFSDCQNSLRSARTMDCPRLRWNWNGFRRWPIMFRTILGFFQNKINLKKEDALMNVFPAGRWVGSVLQRCHSLNTWWRHSLKSHLDPHQIYLFSNQSIDHSFCVRNYHFWATGGSLSERLFIRRQILNWGTEKGGKEWERFHLNFPSFCHQMWGEKLWYPHYLLELWGQWWWWWPWLLAWREAKLLPLTPLPTPSLSPPTHTHAQHQPKSANMGGCGPCNLSSILSWLVSYSSKKLSPINNAVWDGCHTEGYKW